MEYTHGYVRVVQTTHLNIDEYLIPHDGNVRIFGKMILD
jgi:hypothetical protein